MEGRRIVVEGYTKRLANYCSKLSYDAIPEKVVENIKWAILDNLGVILAGSTFEVGRSIAEYGRGLGDREEATVLGFGFKSSTSNAAFVNGSLSEIVEMQDGNTRGGLHACDAVISASLAMCEWQEKTGKDLITGVVAGYEVGNRVAEAIYPAHRYRGFMSNGTVGTVGAAAAVGRILGLNTELMSNALGIAGFILPVTTYDSHYGGYSIKIVQGGAAAKSGIESALLARQGLTGAPLEGDPGIQRGFCRIVGDESPKFEETIESLGKRYAVNEIYHKPYASCRINHGPIEIALDLKEKFALHAEDIEDILIKTFDFAAKRVGSTKTDTNSSFILCQFSTSYAVAGALMDGEVGLRQLREERIRDPRIHELGLKVKVIADPELQKMYPATRPAIVEITTKDGKKYTGRVDYAKGDYRKPMTEEELVAKFLGLTKDVIGEKKGKKAIDTLLDMENLDMTTRLIEFLN